MVRYWWMLEVESAEDEEKCVYHIGGKGGFVDEETWLLKIWLEWFVVSFDEGRRSVTLNDRIEGHMDVLGRMRFWWSDLTFLSNMCVFCSSFDVYRWLILNWNDLLSVFKRCSYFFRWNFRRLVNIFYNRIWICASSSTSIVRSGRLYASLKNPCDRADSNSRRWRLFLFYPPNVPASCLFPRVRSSITLLKPGSIRLSEVKFLDLTFEPIPKSWDWAPMTLEWVGFPYSATARIVLSARGSAAVMTAAMSAGESFHRRGKV